MKGPWPLQWPEGWARTPAHDRIKSRFGLKGSGQVSFSGARGWLLDELSRLGAANAVITSDLPTRNDGLPYASGRSDDPGIAVWFVLPDNHGNMQERVFPCDKWRSHAENMQAIAKSVEAMRGLDRWGVGDIVSRAFSGFNALPPGSSDSEPQAPVKRPWWVVLDIATNLRGAFSKEELLAVIRTRHRALIRGAHPDAGGSHEAAVELNAALAEAELELAP